MDTTNRMTTEEALSTAKEYLVIEFSVVPSEFTTTGDSAFEFTFLNFALRPCEGRVDTDVTKTFVREFADAAKEYFEEKTRGSLVNSLEGL